MVDTKLTESDLFSTLLDLNDSHLAEIKAINPREFRNLFDYSWAKRVIKDGIKDYSIAPAIIMGGRVETLRETAKMAYNSGLQECWSRAVFVTRSFPDLMSRISIEANRTNILVNEWHQANPNADCAYVDEALKPYADKLQSLVGWEHHNTAEEIMNFVERENAVEYLNEIRMYARQGKRMFQNHAQPKASAA